MQPLRQNQYHTSEDISSSCLFDMTQKSYPRIIGRDSEIERAIEVLSRKNKANPILVGDAGVGKTSIVEGLVNLIQSDNVPDSLRNRKVFSMDLSLLGGSISQMRDALNVVMTEDAILFIDEIHNVIGAGKTQGSLDLANVLKPYLTNGMLTCIGATTYEEYQKYFQNDVALERRFSKIEIKEPSIQDCISMINACKGSYEKFHNVSISEEAVESAVKLSKRYCPNKKLPDSALDLIDESCAKLSLKNKKEVNDVRNYMELNHPSFKKFDPNGVALDYLVETDTLTKEDILNVISSRTGIPTESLNKNDKSKLLNLEKTLGEKIKGQDQVLQKLANQVRAIKSGLKIGNCSFLFLGSSGVGKTETAKALNEALFDTDDILRFDMSEYQQKHDVSKLIGAPAGYVGYENGGALTESVKKKPYGIILLDEIEKAHRDVFDILLQVLDEGVLTDNKGVKVDFKNTIIIMTSNLKEQDLSSFFRPELINRISEVITFNQLTRDVVESIAQYKLARLMSRLKEEYKISLELSSSLVKRVIDNTNFESYGARDIDRAIHRIIEVPLSKILLSQELPEGECVILN
jgi:ATP-dependent Clp protease ATP-binding subunit ClpC